MTQIGNVYGQALYALAKDEDLCEVIYHDLQVLKTCFEAENEYLVLLAAANISVEELGDLSGRFNYEFVCDISKRVPRTYLE